MKHSLEAAASPDQAPSSPPTPPTHAPVTTTPGLHGLSRQLAGISGRGLLRHHLSPFLGEAFGRNASRVDTGVARYPADLAVYPLEHLQMPRLHPSIAASQTTVFPDSHRQHPVPEVLNRLDLVMVIFPSRPVAHEEGTIAAVPS